MCSQCSDGLGDHGRKLGRSGSDTKEFEHSLYMVKEEQGSTPQLSRPNMQTVSHRNAHIQPSLLGLPCELWEHILTQLTEISTHVQLAAVCRLWRAVLKRRITLSALPPPGRCLRVLIRGRCPALLCILRRCTSLATLAVSADLLSGPFTAALRRLECANTLRALIVHHVADMKPIPVNRVLTALPALESLDADDDRIFTFRSQVDLRHSVKVLSMCCSDTSLPSRHLWTRGLAALRRLSLTLINRPVAKTQKFSPPPTGTPITGHRCRRMKSHTRPSIAGSRSPRDFPLSAPHPTPTLQYRLPVLSGRPARGCSSA